MNRHHKQKSREIKDIMRTDVWRKMSYKEAKRKWKSGIRAFRVGNAYIWKSFDYTRLGYNREQMRELGRAYYKILEYCADKELMFDCEFEPWMYAYRLRFRGTDYNSGQRFGYMQRVTIDLLRHAHSLTSLAEYILEELDRDLKARNIHSVKLKQPVWSPLIRFDAPIIQPCAFIKVEPVLGKLVEKESL